MPLATIHDLHVRFRGPALLDGISFLIEPGQKIGLLGRNGSGKTTLLRILSGQAQPDNGQITWSPHARVALLRQDVPQDIEGCVRDVVAAGASGPGHEHDVHEAAWRADQAVEQILSRMNLDGETRFERLSSGMKRRVLLAQAMVSGPDLLLLDEPTNHLDIEAVTWLEDFLVRWRGALLFVTHDRMFLRKLATRIIEIDRGRLFDWSCDYDTFLKRKANELAAEEKQNALFDKKLAQEEVWIRTGIKARRTRNEGRVRALEQMRRVRSERRTSPGKVRMQIQEAQRSGTLVADVENVSFAYGDKPILRDFSTTIFRGDKIGIIGPNGAGKTTLLRILLGQLSPQQGNVRLGTNLQIAYFDQLRMQLSDEKTVQEDVGDGYDTIRIGDQSRHIIGYLQDFLFEPERARTQIRFLSGGERNRVLLAKLFARPANVIVLDEPTNDLDAETLELLEERLVEYQGTVLTVSHDREFLNNVVTSTIVFEPDGVREYVGGYDDWLRQRASEASAAASRESRSPRAGDPPAAAGSSAPVSSESATAAAASAKRRLSYKEQQELKQLPEKIEQLEARIAEMHAAMAQADFYRQPGERIAEQQASLAKLEADLTTAFARWEELEANAT